MVDSIPPFLHRQLCGQPLSLDFSGTSLVLILVYSDVFLVPCSAGNIPVQQRVVLGCLEKEPTGLFDGDLKVTRVGAFLYTCTPLVSCPCKQIFADQCNRIVSCRG